MFEREHMEKKKVGDDQTAGLQVELQVIEHSELRGTECQVGAHISVNHVVVLV